MSVNLVNLNVNPCKLCMPMGSVSAFYGIHKCMTILHGSQGCSTYIRRHMATHYNEPVDIASSSLTEQGTVFGGEKNLIKGLENLIRLYDPEVIGVATTCLAETIGEDIPRIIRDFYDTHPECKAKIINVASAGYAGTQYEGFFAALHAVVSSVEMDRTPNNKLNVVTGMLSPADTRYLKGLFREMGLDVILLPDLSENLDGGHVAEYSRLPGGGTTLHEISQMADARLTVELSAFVSEQYSPARYLKETYGVPYARLNLPVGLRDTDAFLEALCHAGGILTPNLKQERARYLDAMVDSHKYNAKGRAALYGEPDFVYALTRLCTENGVLPVVAATGAKCERFVSGVTAELEAAVQPAMAERFRIADDADFDSIEAWAVEYGANLLIGNSDGRRISHKHHIPLIRCGFPIHDFVGGQRIRMLGYEGSLALLDQATNALLESVESTFREELYNKYYRGENKSFRALPSSLKVREEETRRSVAEKTATHPCFNGCGGQYARIHLPVAKACNIQCNYCVRKFDCPNESRPGVTTRMLTPTEAYNKYLEAKERVPNLTVVGIAGPGDALANYEVTKRTLEMVRMADPDVTFCLSTNGLMLPQYANELITLGVSHVTVTVNAVDVEIASKIYKHVTYMGETYTSVAAAAMLLANQLSGIKMLTEKGVVVKVNIVMLKGVNDAHIPAVVEKMKALGVRITNIMQLIPVKGSAFADMPLVSNREIMEMRRACEETLEQMYHCRQCRADAVGTLDHDRSAELFCGGCPSKKETEQPIGQPPVAVVPEQQGKAPEPERERLRFAVSSHGGVLVDQHFGHASDFYIYDFCGGAVRFQERRSVGKYCDGTDDCTGRGDGSGKATGKEGKMDEILEAVRDCDCVITMRIGDAPKKKLTDRGVRVVTSYGRIEDAVNEAALEYCAL